MIEITKHAFTRLKERMGLNRKAARRHAEKAFTDGISPKEYPYREIGELYAKRQIFDTGRFYLFYRDIVHIFAVNDLNIPVLVTVYDPLEIDE